MINDVKRIAVSYARTAEQGEVRTLQSVIIRLLSLIFWNYYQFEVRFKNLRKTGVWTAALSVAAWSGGALYGQSAVLTWHNDNARTGQNLQEMTLTPANVNAATFGKLFVLPVDGKVDAQPLYVPSVAIPGQGTVNVVFAATEHDSAYAFDADLGTQLWHVSLLGANETTSDDRGCDQVEPEIGVTATPVIDLQTGAHGTMYVVAMSKDGSGNYHQRLHALDLATGAEELGGPAEIQAIYPGSGAEGSGGTLTFDPSLHKERAALLLVDGVVYTSWSSHCDGGPYTSWVIGYDKATLKQANVLNLVPNGLGGGIWQAGAGPAADSKGNLYLLTGNGTFDSTLGSSGLPASGDYGNAFVKISTSGGKLAVADYFTMAATNLESNEDTDLGSGGILLLPAVGGSQGKSRALGVGAGKDQTIYVVDLNNLGQFNSRADTIYQELPSALNPVFSSPAWFNNTLYYGSIGNALMAFPFANGSLAPAPVAQTSTYFGYPGTTPSISANGISNGIVWAVEYQSPAVLHAYDASNALSELYNSGQAPNGRDQFGDGNRFVVPTVVNGKVYVGTASGVGVFGLLPPACNYAITPQNIAIDAGGGSGIVNITTSSSCGWSAVTNTVWIAITSWPSGAGNGTLAYTVAVNDSSSQRVGTLTVAGQTFTITQAPTCNYAISPQTIAVGAGGGSGIVNITTSSSCGWSAVTNTAWMTITSWPSGAGNGTLAYTVAATDSFSQRVGTLTVAGQTFTVTQAANPDVIISTVSNAASSVPGTIAPGEIITIKGSLLGPAQATSLSVDPATGLVSTSVAGTRVFFDSFAAPILYTSATQINAVVPYEIAGRSQVAVHVEYQGVASLSTMVSVADTAPAIFTLDTTGSGQAAALNLDYSVNGPSNPAKKGSYVSIYFTGGGQTSPAGVTGSITGLVFKNLVEHMSVTVGGQPATVTFEGAAPAYIDGLSQLNIRLADDTPSGAQPVVIQMGNITSPASATIYVF